MASRLMTGSTSRRWRDLAPRLGLPVPTADDYIEILEGADLDAWFAMASSVRVMYARRYRPDCILLFAPTKQSVLMDQRVRDVLDSGDGLLLTELVMLVDEMRDDIAQRSPEGVGENRVVWA